MSTQLYNQDYYCWISETVSLLKAAEYEALDIPSLIEEIDSMTGQERQALESNLTIVLMHLLKYQYQPQKRTRSWLLTLFEHRRHLTRQLKNSPSLKPYLNEVLAECYSDARKLAEIETELDIFPIKCPYTSEQAVDQEFLPG